MRGNVRQYGMVVALAVIVILFQIWTSGILLKPLNVTNIVQQNGYILILAIGMVIVIINGHIDLSVGSIAGFVGAMSAVLMIRNDMPWPVAVALCLLMGAVIGAWQGFWIAYIGIPSFIVTLAGMLVFRGATQYLLEGQSIAPFPPQLQPGQQRLPARGGRGQPVPLADGHPRRPRDGRRGVAAGAAATHAGALWIRRRSAELVRVQVRRDRRRAGCVHTAAGELPRHPPVVGIILAVAFVVYAFVMRGTVFGRQVYAVGGNEAAARLSGVKTKRTTFLVFVNMGGCCPRWRVCCSRRG